MMIVDVHPCEADCINNSNFTYLVNNNTSELMATSTLLSVLLSVGVLVALVTCGDSDKGCCMPRQFKARAPITIDIGQYIDYII